MRHDQQLLVLKDYLKETLVPKMRPTSDILNMRRIEEQLRSQKNYPEAKKVMKVIKNLEAQEMEAAIKEVD